jgi:branched-chain amino acid transport system permease protein
MVPYSKLLVLLVAVVSFGVSMIASQLDDYVLSVATSVAINILLASSLNLVNGHAGQFSLGHAGFMSVGGYAAAYLTTVRGPEILATLGISSSSALAAYGFFPLALIVGGLAAAVAGLLVGIPSLRLKGDYLAIVTLGFGEIIRVLLQNTDAVGASRGLSGIPHWTNLFWAFTIAAICVYVVGSLVTSTYGRGFLATRDDEIAAEAMGVNTTAFKVKAFVIGAFFAGIAGGLFGHYNQIIDPASFGFMRSVDIVVIVILGGMGRTFGVIIAAIVLTVLLEVLRNFQDYRMILYSLLIILLMILRPQGLFGGWKRKPEQKEGAAV